MQIKGDTYVFTRRSITSWFTLQKKGFERIIELESIKTFGKYYWKQTKFRYWPSARDDLGPLGGQVIQPVLSLPPHLCLP